MGPGGELERDDEDRAEDQRTEREPDQLRIGPAVSAFIEGARGHARHHDFRVSHECGGCPKPAYKLFGHEKGAFTGATRTKPGLLETAHHGTVFLDELGELPVGLQVKLLRVLQEKQIRRVGGTNVINVDVRVVSATNRNLREAVQKGTFREELYYRINVIAIELPPLRERAGDIRLLAHAFLKKFGGERVTLDDGATAALEAYAWPGNVRELQNVIERALRAGGRDHHRPPRSRRPCPAGYRRPGHGDVARRR
jgi:transcriptional regulator with PAS, ATPase and Fis domain